MTLNNQKRNSQYFRNLINVYYLSQKKNVTKTFVISHHVNDIRSETIVCHLPKYLLFKICII